ncbi:hypothetical protein [Enterovirga rhinocerotis]|uniref:Uncharacterized protein n=1 Tax=Enterovirga rhinocerotis TaxID=1339210 RepID=A0A4R7C759_9HYPH|nr:hypothetical protein [Enterovirga rhinocerotis]TDR94460.1 hypothetical protein EV668_1747 [Enterovirga rhinocerotis]
MPETDASAASASAYDAIVGALASTARGRAFLAEHARRIRAEETGTLLDAIARLDSRVSDLRPPPDRNGIRSRAEAIEAAILDVERQLRPDWLGVTAENDAARRDLADAARWAAAAITKEAEGIQDTAWMMREAGFDAELCDQLDRHAIALGDAGAASLAVAATLAALARAARVAAMETARLTHLTRGRTSAVPPVGAEGVAAGQSEPSSRDETAAGRYGSPAE